MRIQLASAGLVAAGLTLAIIPLGCGAAQEEYLVVERPSHEATDELRKDDLSAEVRGQVENCFKLHKGPWSQRKYSAHYKANSNERGVLRDVELQKTTLDDDLEVCVRKVIATITIPEAALRSGSSRPFSGGERMQREQRALVGSNESQNPIVWAFAIALEAVEFDVVVQVVVGAIAAVGTLAQPRKNPKDECIDKYDACMDTLLGRIQVDKRGTTVCASCLNLCIAQKLWPSGFEITNRWQTCM